MYKFFFIIHACTEKRKRKRSLGCARDDETGKGCLASLSSHLGSQPPPLRGTSFRGKEGICRLPASSFRAKARNLFRSRSRTAVRRGITGSTALPAARDEKDCLAFLFIPRREPTSAPSGHLLPGEGGSMPPSPHALFPHLNTRTGWRPVRAVFLESSEWSSHKTIGL